MFSTVKKSKLIIFSIAMLFVAIGCSEDKNACEQQSIDCSGHGTCVMQNDQPTCQCDDGYGPDGIQCVMDYDMLVFQTNDRHSHWLGLLNCDYDPASATDGTVGGAARWYNVVKEAKDGDKDVMLLSAGDFTMGTMLVEAEGTAGDLNTMTALGYDAAALGNHEFDWGPGGLARMIQAANKPVLPLVCSNIRFDPDDPADDALEAMYGPQGQDGKYIHPYLVIDRPSGIKVGIVGLVGIEAEKVSNAEPVKFSVTMDNMVDTTQQLVNTLRNDEKVDLVIVLAHAGVKPEGDSWGFESIELARRVEGIDAILSGHEHTPMDKGVEVACENEGSTWKTLVMEAGKYGLYLGKWELSRKNGAKSASANLIPVDGSLGESASTTEAIEKLFTDVEENFLSSYPQVPDEGAFLSGDIFQQLTCSEFDLNRHYFENNNLGYLLADAVAEITKAQFVVISNGGDLRASLQRCSNGCFDLSDAFISTPLGTGPDGMLGYPVVTFYLKWRELKLVLEATIPTEGLKRNDFMLNLAGMRIRYDTSVPDGMFQRIDRVELYDAADETAEGTVIYQKGDPNDGWHVEPDELVKLSLSLYIATFLQSFNLRPRDSEGEPVLDQNSHVDWTSLIEHDAQGHELKIWYVLAQKLASFGESGVPLQYCDDEFKNPIGPYWRRACDINSGSENSTGHVCP